MKNEKVQVTGVAVATNGNGNGNGKKAPKDNVKVNENFDLKESLRITPHFDFLTTKGVEMFTNMSNLENAKLYMNGLAMELGNDTAELTGLLMILDSISRKLGGTDSDYLSAGDYINWLQDYIFHWTSIGDKCADVYIEAVRSGNFVIGETRNTDDEVWTEGIFPPKYKLKPQENALRSELSALAETVKSLQDQIGGKTVSSFQPQTASPITFEAVKDAGIDEIGIILSALLENDRVPVRLDSGICDGIGACVPAGIDGNFTPEFISKCIRLETERVAEKRAEQSAKTDSITEVFDPNYDPNNGEGDSMNEIRGGMLGMALSELLDNPHLPRKILNALFDSIASCADPKTLEGADFTEEFVTEAIRYENERIADSKPNDLATHLSAILNNPETPKSLYRAISDELSTLFDGDELTKVVNSAEFIAKALKTKEPALAA